MQAEINSNKDMALKTMGETEEMAQYLRRDCLEISGVKPNAEFSSENIVESIGEGPECQRHREGYFSCSSTAFVQERRVAKTNCEIDTQECS